MTWNPFAPRLPWIGNEGRTMWPRWPVVRVSGRLYREGRVPPRPYRRAVRVYAVDVWLYAWPVFAECLRVARWYAIHRWDLEDLFLRRGIMIGEDGGYYRDAKFAPIRQWFRR